MAFAVISRAHQVWRATNPLGVLNTNLTAALGYRDVGIRIWRVAPGQAIPRHRHRHQTEIYVLLEGRGRMRIGDAVLSVDPLSAVRVDPDDVRQVFNDTDADALWLIAGAPPESFPLSAEAHTAELAHLYPDGVTALPPELAGD
jgi:uncharacterized cupin superfamily protein